MAELSLLPIIVTVFYRLATNAGRVSELNPSSPEQGVFLEERDLAGRQPGDVGRADGGRRRTGAQWTPAAPVETVPPNHGRAETTDGGDG